MENKDYIRTIYLAGGCFWGVEEYYRRLKGIIATEVGYAQGHTEHPSYEEVCTGTSGHTETVKVIYDHRDLALVQVLDHFFRMIDPTQVNRQGNDVGTQYRSGIYTTNHNDLLIAQDFVQERQSHYKDRIAVEVELLKNYFPAEEHHQIYLAKNPGGYCHIDFSLIEKDELK